MKSTNLHGTRQSERASLCKVQINSIPNPVQVVGQLQRVNSISEGWALLEQGKGWWGG